ncbi:MAG: hypothetical protein AAGA92_03900 [Planctomycetota bacterium]
MGLIKNFKRHLKRRYGSEALLTRVAKQQTGTTISGGPFQGLRYVGKSYNAAYLPKLAGCYERELNPVIEQAVSGAYDRIIDVGSAEGYFAVGMATRCDTPVYAFELDCRARDLSRELARRNGVEQQIEFLPGCEPPGLESALAGSDRPFVLMDVEGYEAVLLNADAVPSLTRAAVLVELHEFARPGITADLFRKFGATHEIEVIWQTPRTADDYPFASPLTRLVSRRQIWKAVDENRGFSQSWLWMLPKDQAAQAA